MTAAGLMLFPGAGASRDNRTLVAIERALDPLPVRRVDFPNRTAGRGGPEKPAIAVAHVHAQAADFAAELGCTTAELVVGGRSFGGRMASMAVAEGLAVAGLALLSYPLHPPGKPETLRIAHLPEIAVPTLVASGERDPFGTPEELRTQLAAVAGPVTFAFVAGNHSPADGPVIAAIRAWLATL